MLSQVKLIAEPWDVGPGGYQVGNFPVLWSEWNGVYRDTMRDYWRGHAERRRVRVAAVGLRRPVRGRRPRPVRVDQLHHRPRRLHARATSSPTSDKHNEANLEDNRDGTDDNRSWNCGVEGETDDPEILALRAPPAAQLPGHAAALPGHADAARRRRARSHASAATTTPGARTTSSPGTTGARPDAQGELREFTRRLIRLRREHPVFRRETLPRGEEGERSGLPDVWWFRADGRKMTSRDWQRRRARARDVPQRARDRLDRARTARRSRTTRSCCCSTPSPRTGAFMLPRRRFGRAVGARALDRRSRRRGGERRLWRADRGQGDLALDRDPEARRVSEPHRAAGHLPAPADARGFGFAAARRADPLPARPRRSRTCTCRRRCRRAPVRPTATT